MESSCVKHLIGLKLAEAGISSFAEAARLLGIKRAYFSLIIHGHERPEKHQHALARLCGCRAEDLFGEFTHPHLRGLGYPRKIYRTRKESK